MFPTSGFLQL